MTLENLFLTSFKLTTAEQVQGTLASILLALADKEYGSSISRAWAPKRSTATRHLRPLHQSAQDLCESLTYDVALWTGRLYLTANALTGEISAEGRRHSCSPNRIDWKEFSGWKCARGVRVRFVSHSDSRRRQASAGISVLGIAESVQFWDHVSGGRGTAQKNVNAKKLEQFAVPVPPPEVQQLLAAWMTARATGYSTEQPPCLMRLRLFLRYLGHSDTVTEIHDALERSRSVSMHGLRRC